MSPQGGGGRRERLGGRDDEPVVPGEEEEAGVGRPDEQEDVWPGIGEGYGGETRDRAPRQELAARGEAGSADIPDFEAVGLGDEEALAARRREVPCEDGVRDGRRRERLALAGDMMRGQPAVSPRLCTAWPLD